MSTDCKEMEGLLIQRAYGETLSGDEARVLDAHLGACTGCREAQASVAAVVSGIPRDDFVYEGDLLPAIQEGLRAPKPLLPWQWIFTSGAVVLVLFMTAVFLALPRQAGDVSSGTRVAESPVQKAFVLADRAVEDEEFARAYVILTDVVKNYEPEPASGGALLRAADIAYAELGWYPQAHEVYRQAQSNFFEDFSGSTDAVRRFNVLEEAYAIDAAYESLYALDAAITRDTVEALEAYVVRYPASFTASDATYRMAQLALRETDGDGSLADGYEAAIAMSSHPLAVASLKMELAHVYERGDDEKARVLLEDVAAHGPTILAQRARESLATMGDPE